MQFLVTISLARPSDNNAETAFLVDDDAHAALFQQLHEQGSVLQAYMAADFIGYFLLMQAESADQLNHLLAGLPLAEERDQIQVEVKGLEPLPLKPTAQP